MPVITIGENQREYKAGTTLLQISEDYQQQFSHDILLAEVNGQLQELYQTVDKDANVQFLTAADVPGQQAYERSVILLFLDAVYKNIPSEQFEKVIVHFSVTHGYYVEIRGTVKLTQELLERIEEYMKEIAAQKLPIKKRMIKTEDAIELFQKNRFVDKARLFHYRRNSNVNLYNLDGFEDYYYGYMVPDSGYLKYFDLKLYADGLVILLPDLKNPEQVAEFEPAHKVFASLLEATHWSSCMGVESIGELNDMISRGMANELILVQEALQEGKLADIAEQIKKRKECKFVMIAGPSSSGKTTTSRRLSVQLMAQGMKPHPVTVDNYFVNREFTPRDENGELNFEALECVDLEGFNRDMTALLAGETVDMPTFNFETGMREYRGDKMKLGPDDILVIEGIHALNDAMSYALPKESKYKIYISALNPLNIDEHNRIPTTDGRLLRRMVRDARTRGTSALETIARWPSVRRGEDSNIFPFQEDADIVFNSSLIYELAVLKVQAEPLLFGIPKDVPEYKEAKRLLKFLNYVQAIDTEMIPKNSILREFIGGSCFHV